MIDFAIVCNQLVDRDLRFGLPCYIVYTGIQLQIIYYLFTYNIHDIFTSYHGHRLYIV